MRAIAVADRNWGIGKDGGLIYDLPGDLRYFSDMTRGKVVVMGSATLRSLPGGRPLRNRVNVVLSRNPDLQAEGAVVVRSRDELREAVKDFRPEDVMLIGGETLYAQYIACCDVAYVTRVEAQAPADRFFPDLDRLPGWRLAHCSEPVVENGIRYAFCEYANDRVEEL
ncbi:MAG TPA: dihydrofolate reductase [Candidatus Limnocylindria bacterium]|nr:dihydrofolate reductase [Candidatus Limnocylindria bacterium]